MIEELGVIEELMARVILWVMVVVLAVLSFVSLVMWLLALAVRRARRWTLCTDCQTWMRALPRWLHRKDPLRRHRCAQRQADRAALIFQHLTRQRRPPRPDPITVADEYARSEARHAERTRRRGWWRR